MIYLIICVGTEQSFLWNSGFTYHYTYRGAIRIGTSKVLNLEAVIGIETRNASHLLFKVTILFLDLSFYHPIYLKNKSSNLTLLSRLVMLCVSRSILGYAFFN